MLSETIQNCLGYNLQDYQPIHVLLDNYKGFFLKEMKIKIIQSSKFICNNSYLLKKKSLIFLLKSMALISISLRSLPFTRKSHCSRKSQLQINTHIPQLSKTRYTATTAPPFTTSRESQSLNNCLFIAQFHIAGLCFGQFMTAHLH